MTKTKIKNDVQKDIEQIETDLIEKNRDFSLSYLYHTQNKRYATSMFSLSIIVGLITGIASNFIIQTFFIIDKTYFIYIGVISLIVIIIFGLFISFKSWRIIKDEENAYNDFKKYNQISLSILEEKLKKNKELIKDDNK